MFKVKDKELVLPGQVLGENVLAGAYCFKENDLVFSSVRGIVKTDRKFVKVIPFDGKYVPKGGDIVIGIIEGNSTGGWFVDLNSGYTGYMRGEEVTRNPMQEDLSRYYNIGDRFTAKVVEVNEIYKCNLINPWKLKGGSIINISPKKVPRVIGKQKSMINMLRDKTRCKIVVGQNGRIWLNDDDPDRIKFAVKIIKIIEEKAHTPGLTDKIGNLIDEELKNK